MSLTLGLNSTTYRLLSNITSLETQRSTTMTRLATGKRINTAADDPAGIVALSGMNADMARINAAIDNNERARAMLDTADATLKEIGNLVKQVEDAAIKAQDPNATTAEIAAYQSTIDQSLDSIDSLLSTASFNGTKLFTGTNGITATSSDTAVIDDAHIYSQDPGQTGNVDITVTFASGAATVQVGSGTTVDFGTVSNGDEISFSIDGFSGKFTVVDNSDGSETITVTDAQGIAFQLGTNSSTQTRLDLGAGLQTTELGDAVGGYLSSLRSGGAADLSTSPSTAATIAAKASRQVALAQSREGTFNKYQVGASLNALNAQKAAQADLISQIEDTDFAEETAKLDRQNVLMQAAIAMLATSNQSRSNVLALLL